MKTITEKEVRARLKDKFEEHHVDELINEYIEAIADEIPDAEKVSVLSKKGSPDTKLRVSFKLTLDQYNALAASFQEEDRAGTFLVQAAVKEFIHLNGM